MQDNYSIGLADGPGQHEIGYGTKISSIWAHGKPHFTTVSLFWEGKVLLNPEEGTDYMYYDLHHLCL